jgi:hypothetical protein
MNEIRTRVLVDRDHRISGIAPAHVPAGDHEVTIRVLRRPHQIRTSADIMILPTS